MKPIHLVRADSIHYSWKVIDGSDRYVETYLQQELNNGYVLKQIEAINLDARHLLIQTEYNPKEARRHPAYEGHLTWWQRIYYTLESWQLGR